MPYGTIRKSMKTLATWAENILPVGNPCVSFGFTFVTTATYWLSSAVRNTGQGFSTMINPSWPLAGNIYNWFQFGFHPNLCVCVAAACFSGDNASNMRLVEASSHGIIHFTLSRMTCHYIIVWVVQNSTWMRLRHNCLDSPVKEYHLHIQSASINSIILIFLANTSRGFFAENIHGLMMQKQL